MADALNNEESNDTGDSNIVDLVELLAEMDQIEKDRINRLKTEPNGFPIEAKGGTCHGCSVMFFEEELWYDKWGLKCMNCQEALDKEVMPGYVFTDYHNEKSINITDLSDKTNLYQQTLKKLVRQGKLKACVYKEGKGRELWMFLYQDNPNLAAIINDEQKRLK